MQHFIALIHFSIKNYHFLAILINTIVKVRTNEKFINYYQQIIIYYCPLRLLISNKIVFAVSNNKTKTSELVSIKKIKIR